MTTHELESLLLQLGLRLSRSTGPGHAPGAVRLLADALRRRRARPGAPSRSGGPAALQAAVEAAGMVGWDRAEERMADAIHAYELATRGGAG